MPGRIDGGGVVKGSELANVLGLIDELGPNTPADRVTAIVGLVAAAAPAIRAAVGLIEDVAAGVEDVDNLDERLAAAIAKASSRNRSREVQEELQAELDELEALNGPDTERPK